MDGSSIWILSLIIAWSIDGIHEYDLVWSLHFLMCESLLLFSSISSHLVLSSMDVWFLLWSTHALLLWCWKIILYVNVCVSEPLPPFFSIFCYSFESRSEFEFDFVSDMRLLKMDLPGCQARIGIVARFLVKFSSEYDFF